MVAGFAALRMDGFNLELINVFHSTMQTFIPKAFGTHIIWFCPDSYRDRLGNAIFSKADVQSAIEN